jgi:hypothetical protein
METFSLRLTMNRLQESLARAARELGHRIIAPFELTVDAGRVLVADALFPDLGAPRGMLVVQSYDALRPFLDEFESAGYGYSVIGEPPVREVFELEGYREMFNDWGVWHQGRPS